MTRFTRLSWLAAGFAAIVAIAAANRPVAAEETVRLAYLKTLGIVPIIDAQQTGYFAKEGIKVEMITLNNGPAVVSAVVGGSADIGFSATLPVISAVAEHQPIREFMISGVERWPLEEGIGEYVIASARSGAKTLQDLKGKTVASNATNGGCDLMIRDHIRAAGIPASAMKMAVIPFPQMKAALELGTVDAVCAHRPVLFGDHGLAADQDPLSSQEASSRICRRSAPSQSVAISGGWIGSPRTRRQQPASCGQWWQPTKTWPPTTTNTVRSSSANSRCRPSLPTRSGSRRTRAVSLLSLSNWRRRSRRWCAPGCLKEAIPAADVVFTIQP